MDAGIAHQRDVLRAEDATLGDQQAVTRHRLLHVQRGLQRHLEGAQVAVVDADHRRRHLQRALQFVDVMHFHQHVHAQRQRQLGQRGQLGIVQRGDDQQDAVGAQHARLVHLVGVDDEILAQHRQRAGFAGLLQIGVGALEEVHVGQHRQAAGATELVADGDVGRAEIRADHALGGAGLLHLGDHRRVAIGHRRLQRAHEATHRRGAGHGGLQLLERALGAALGHFFGLAGQDRLQDVAHRLRVGAGGGEDGHYRPSRGSG